MKESVDPVGLGVHLLLVPGLDGYGYYGGSCFGSMLNECVVSGVCHYDGCLWVSDQRWEWFRVCSLVLCAVLDSY